MAFTDLRKLFLGLLLPIFVCETVAGAIKLDELATFAVAVEILDAGTALGVAPPGVTLGCLDSNS